MNKKHPSIFHQCLTIPRLGFSESDSTVYFLFVKNPLLFRAGAV